MVTSVGEHARRLQAILLQIIPFGFDVPMRPA
ncbi:hypothetical protein FHY13_003645 [Xanthomonas arboricola]|nr:hypothetical protein [Xanthomonas euroxanthea]MBB5769524.1 hypothetical protein [Xanthomonas euroxanthea]